MINIDDRILSEVDENQLFLLCAIAKHMGNNAKAWPSNRSLCETTRWSANKLQRVKKSAIEAGILGAESRFQKNAQTSNLYQIKTRRIGVMVNLADIAPHPQNGVSPHPQNDTPAPPQNGVSPHPQNGDTEVLTNEVLTNEREGERTPPAPNPSNLQSPKKENGLVSPPGFGNFDHFSGFGLDYLKTPETVKAETPPLPKVAPKGIPPVRLDAKEIRGLVDLTETYPFGFCETCQGQKVVGGRNGLIECPTCEGTGLGNGRTESENPPPAQFEVTAISSPTELPGVTLVEAAPIHHRRNGRIEIPDEAAAEILPWAKGDGEQTVKSWYDRAFRQHSPKDVEDMVMRFSTVFLSSEKAAFRDMMETNPLSFFKRRFAGFVADQKQYDRNNAPKEGGATRQNGQPHSALPRSLQKQVGK